jgi:hypothetical protein
MFKLVAAAGIGYTVLALTGDVPKTTYIEGDRAWLATQTCSFGDPEQCASEAAMKALLRDGRVKVGG